MTGVDGRIWTAAWAPGDQGWRGWWSIGNLRVAARTPVGVESRSSGLLDVFVAGIDLNVYTAAWVPGDQDWRGWWALA